MRNSREIRLGGVFFDTHTHELRDRTGSRIFLRNKSTEVLACLAACPDQLVAKSEIMDLVWPDVTVSDESLTQCIADIRRAIGDKDQSVLKTHIGRGYSLSLGENHAARPRLKQMVAGALSAVAIAVTAIMIFPLLQPTPSGNGVPRVAVLAFDDLSAGEEKGWLGDGIAEGVITELASYQEFLVLARNSSFSFRDRPTEISEIASKLNADFIVEGSKQKSGDRLRVTVQLIDASDGTHLWADEYNTDIGELFEVQSKIVRSIATQLGRELAWSPPQKGGREKVNALHYYFLGNKAFSERNPEALRRAIDHYENAIAADPEAAFGYIGMATVIWHDITQGWVYGDVPYQELLQRGIDYAEAAIAADPTNYASHISRGDLHTSAGQLEDAIIRYKMAAELNPSSSTAMAVAAEPLMYLGRTDEAIEMLERAMDVNPIVPGWYYNTLSRAYWDAGRCEEGKQAIKKRASMREWDLRALIVNLVCLGELDEAQAAGKRLLELNPDFTVGGHAERVKKVMANERYFERWMESLRAAGLPEA
ncbi:winged helix-turn-helix domain-containing protein [Silicimonas sp. MF1-12-2]|uniref:winged helix-turn-helix domain-containing protein n=1 Tax=Silicimonas sp. MF1-12-2 TaxID=3384793 RepID=UPI0039B6D33F